MKLNNFFIQHLDLKSTDDVFPFKIYVDPRPPVVVSAENWHCTKFPNVNSRCKFWIYRNQASHSKSRSKVVCPENWPGTNFPLRPTSQAPSGIPSPPQTPNSYFFEWNFTLKRKIVSNVTKIYFLERYCQVHKLPAAYPPPQILKHQTRISLNGIWLWKNIFTQRYLPAYITQTIKLQVGQIIRIKNAS